MRIRTIAATLATTTLLSTAVLTTGTAASATSGHGQGTRSLAEVLTSDGNTWDRRGGDYDIVTEAVLAVLDAKPDSAVGVLADGTVKLTAFIPNDRSFRYLVKDLTGVRYGSEKKVFQALVDAAGVDVIEQVLLYHVVPGATIKAKDALAADGVALTTAQGGTFTVDVLYPRLPIVQLKDNDPDDQDPFLNPFALDINKGNKQIAHGIFFVLRPINI
jgi:hypothetical protein